MTESACSFTAATSSEFVFAVLNAEIGELIFVTGDYTVPSGLPVRLSGAGQWIKTASEGERV